MSTKFERYKIVHGEVMTSKSDAEANKASNELTSLFRGMTTDERTQVNEYLSEILMRKPADANV